MYIHTYCAIYIYIYINIYTFTKYIYIYILYLSMDVSLFFIEPTNHRRGPHNGTGLVHHFCQQGPVLTCGRRLESLRQTKDTAPTPKVTGVIQFLGGKMMGFWRKFGRSWGFNAIFHGIFICSWEFTCKMMGCPWDLKQKMRKSWILNGKLWRSWSFNGILMRS